MRKRSIKTTLLFAVISLVMVGCGSRQVVLGPNDDVDALYYEALNQYSQAEMEFTKKLIKYNKWCERVEYLDTCNAVDPYWDVANTALETWRDLVESRKNDTTAKENYLEALKTLKSNLIIQARDFIW